MTRSNSIPTHDASMELYGASPLGSTLSLAERPRSMGMVRSGSFRDKESDEGENTVKTKFCPVSVFNSASYRFTVALNFLFTVHGSVLSLASNASSTYSSVSAGSTQIMLTVYVFCECFDAYNDFRLFHALVHTH